jgi:hypothetical protein
MSGKKGAVRRQITTTLAISLVVAVACAEPIAPGNDFPRLEPSPQRVPDGPLRSAYQEDAVRLAIRHLIDTGSAAQHDVEPPTQLVTSLFNALERVHAFAHPARDTVVDVYRIHSFPHPQTRQLMVRVDPAHEWTRGWSAGNALTGNPTVDSLVVRYDLTLRNYFLWTIGDVALLRAGRPLNATALAARFAPIAGVIWAEPDGAVGDGADIRVSRSSDGWRLDYSVGYGDCPSGCINRRTWSFGVSAAGTVRYLGASGSPPPPPIGG